MAEPLFFLTLIFHALAPNVYNTAASSAMDTPSELPYTWKECQDAGKKAREQNDKISFVCVPAPASTAAKRSAP